MDGPEARLNAMAEVLQIMSRTSVREVTLKGFSRPVAAINVVGIKP